SNTLSSLTSFGNQASVTSSASSTTTTTTTSSVSLKPTTGFSITSLATSSAPQTTTASAPVSLPVTSTAPTTATAAVPQITFGKLEDQINLWMNELTQFESDFHSQGQTINSWDSLLISNGQKLIEMKQTTEKLRSAHRGLDHQLDFIIAQQKELEQLLDQIEQNKYESGSNYVNTEREHTYSMVETVNNDLNAIGSDLKDFIKKLNETKSNQDSNDPIVQISKILNSHMNVLQWVENQIKNLKVNC
ncbi:PREDICTED: nuclear pore glycoprotein p62-like, partial [Rhagoletis zephyria]|uniref:nuclear pore glycoprotein p62-like n=1 Tax=Rhagoletis zephyria TaxID=28612 RepID=UPI0008115A1A